MYGLFCKHEWRTMKDEVLQRTNAVKKMSNVPEDFFIRTHVIILVCEKCGKVKKEVTYF